MRIVVVAHEFPYPPNHGGRVDIWNRIMALKADGAEVFLIAWSGAIKKEKLKPQDVEYVRQMGIAVKVYPLRRGIKRIWATMKWPWHVSSRIIDRREYELALQEIKAFGPEIVLIDGIYSAVTGFRLANDLNCKTGARLHNVEYDYMKGQYELAEGFKQKISLRLSLAHLQRFEDDVIRKADAYFDISVDDLQLRKARGFENGYWLPPIHIPRVPQSQSLSAVSGRAYDLCFLGNLSSPNNISAVSWFVRKVFPKVQTVHPSVSLLVMGSNPANAIRTLCNDNPNISLIENPADPAAHIGKDAILINPAQFGSGVNIKAIEMLFTDNLVVSSRVGIKGLPAEFEKVFDIAVSPAEFAEKIIALMGNKAYPDQLSGRASLRKLFSLQNVSIIRKALSHA